MVAQTRTFIRLGLLSMVGLAFYYAHLFLGMVGNAWIFKMLAVLFLLTAVPLPIIAVNNRKLFPALEKWTKTLVVAGALLLLVHHFLMTFIFVMFLPEGRVL
ncbi:MAG: hypothetical protein J5I62_13630 [Flavobacteriales bacterium]|nr:hypothetical protein [Flavobacteriales bacterium]MEB2341454.1 hypothetical protein [Flavobacteriia bacterium]HRN38350.1 hypothetical protein [Flavobacteriales bacterium]